MATLEPAESLEKLLAGQQREVELLLAILRVLQGMAGAMRVWPVGVLHPGGEAAGVVGYGPTGAAVEPLGVKPAESYAEAVKPPDVKPAESYAGSDKAPDVKPAEGREEAAEREEPPEAKEDTEGPGAQVVRRLSGKSRAALHRAAYLSWYHEWAVQRLLEAEALTPAERAALRWMYEEYWRLRGDVDQLRAEGEEERAAGIVQAFEEFQRGYLVRQQQVGDVPFVRPDVHVHGAVRQSLGRVPSAPQPPMLRWPEGWTPRQTMWDRQLR